MGVRQQLRKSSSIIPEFNKHRCTYALWPTRPDNWRLDARPSQHDMAKLVNTIAKYEPVNLGSNAPICHDLHPAVTIFETQYDDIWVRDTGSTFLMEDRVTARGWQFNS